MQGSWISCAGARALVAAAALGLGCAGSPGALAPEATEEPPADRIYLGQVVTIDANSRIAEALAVKDGRILLVGDERDVLAHRGRDTEVVDLADAALLPGFIDAHSHLLALGVPQTGWANVARPPVGGVASIPDLLDALDGFAHRSGKAPGEWLIGHGYEREALAEGRELTRDDLDARFPERPVAVVHVSGHGGVLNSKALAAVGISAKTPDPRAGQIVRRPGSREPAGLLMELPFFAALERMPKPGEEGVLAALGPAQEHYAANGYTTVQDGLTGVEGLALLGRAAAEGRLFLDIVALADWRVFPALLLDPGLVWGGPYRDHLKLGGVKSVIDGSPQGRTAYFIEPMRVRGPAGQRGWRGQPLLAQHDLDEIFRLALAHGIQTYTHANGDGAIDMFLSAWETIGAPVNARPVVIHSQFVRPEQLAAYARIGAVPSFFTNHTFFWGDLHVENLGERRAHFLSPLRSATERGIRFTNHSDFAVTPLDPMFMLWSATERLSRSGAVIGPEERVGVAEALRALTIDAAYQYFEEDEKGSLEPGKRADLVILDQSPLDVPGDALRDIRILETIKDGETVWKAEQDANGDAEPSFDADSEVE